MSNSNQNSLDFVDEIIHNYAKNTSSRLTFNIESLPKKIVRQFSAIKIKEDKNDLEFLNESNSNRFEQLKVLIENRMIKIEEEQFEKAGFELSMDPENGERFWKKGLRRIY